MHSTPPDTSVATPPETPESPQAIPAVDARPRTARGILIGLVASLPLWVAGIGVIRWLLGRG